MAQRLTTSFVNTNIPGAYPNVTVKSTPVGITSTGDIVIIGEAAGGADYTQETLKDNWYDPTQLSQVVNKYLSGPIVDAMRAMVSPSNDTEIQGSAGRIYIVKTNAGTKASALVAGNSGNYGTISDKNYGVDGNKYYYQITQVEAEAGPSVESPSLTAVLDGSTLDGLEFSVRNDGGAVTSVTLAAGLASQAALIADIDGKLPAGLSCVAGATTDSIKIEADVDANANEKGYGKSFELIDSTPGDLAALGISADLYVSSQEPEIEFSIKRQDTNTNEAFNIEAEIALEIGYDGTTATIEISDGVLTTTVIGGSGSNLNINLSEYPTMNDLAGYITAQTGYTASAASGSINLSPLRLDEVSGIGIATSNSEKAGRIKRAAYNVALAISQSSVADMTFAVAAGLPAEMATAAYFAGGLKGATTAADIVNAIPSLEGIKVNFIVPLFSRDASDDIADGLTDSGSTYTIDAINFAIKSHVLAMSTVKLKRNRIAMLSKWGAYADVKTHAQTLASFRSLLTFQRSSQTNSAGEIVSFMPWHTAALAAGMQSAGFYKPITNRFANAISFTDPSGFDSGNPGSVSDAIDAGLLFLQEETAGVKWVVDQTTYGFDTNFVYNSLQAVYMADVLAIQLADSLQRFVTGKSVADIGAATIVAFISKKMEEYRRLKIIGPSDDAPLGYKNLSVSISGAIADVKMEAKLATQILFIPIDLEISEIQQTATA